MPEDDASERVEQQPAQQSPAVEPIKPSTPPDRPDSPPAQQHSRTLVRKRTAANETGRVKRGERSMVRLTFAIAFFAFCAVVVSAFQWCVMRGQLTEMHNQLELTDRAWIEISDVTIPPPPGFIGLAFWPNKYVPNEKPQVRLGFNIAYKNVGHSPALSIKIAPELYLMDQQHYSDNTAVETERQRFCSIPIKDEARTETSGKSIVFPDQSSTSYRVVTADITEATSYADKELGRVVMPILVICMDYLSSNTHHRSSAVYDLWPGSMPNLPRPHLFGVWAIDHDGTKTLSVNPQRIDADDYAN